MKVVSSSVLTPGKTQAEEQKVNNCSLSHTQEKNEKSNINYCDSNERGQIMRLMSVKRLGWCWEQMKLILIYQNLPSIVSNLQ